MCIGSILPDLLNSLNSRLQAGITTTLNSRCSVLAAANSVFGRWDDTKADDNIDFMPTILSRFDMIFIVKDEHDQNRDIVSIDKKQYHASTNALSPLQRLDRVKCILFTLHHTVEYLAISRHSSICKMLLCSPKIKKE